MVTAQREGTTEGAVKMSAVSMVLLNVYPKLTKYKILHSILQILS